jgi:hypothetical protein
MKTRYIYICLCLIFATTALQAQAPINDPLPYANGILPSQLREHLTVLTSDSCAGREAGTHGNMLAAQYIASQFERIGLPKIKNKDYFQKILFISHGWNTTSIKIKKKEYRYLWDYYSYATLCNSMPLLEDKKVIFLGYGIDDAKYSDYNGRDVAGKIILIYQDEPVNADGVSHISGTTTPSSWSNNYHKKLEVAQKHGVAMVLFIDADLAKNISRYRNYLIGSRLLLADAERTSAQYANHAFISTEMARAIIGHRYRKVVRTRKRIQAKGKPDYVTLHCPITIVQDKSESKIDGANVLGYIEGSDPLLKNELVVVTAHYDHLGKRGNEIFRGADDDGSGTSAVLAVAEAFAKAKKEGHGPRRSVLCMTVTGEEKGLLGSSYYTHYPVFPLENTVVDVNIDMIGRVDDAHKENPNYIYVIGADRLSSELHAINEQMNKTYTNMTLDYTYNAESDPNRYYYRSDHYNFAEKGIPAIFYFNGTHADYHRPSDTIDKINFEMLAKRAQLAFFTAWEIANRSNKIIVDKK